MQRHLRDGNCPGLLVGPLFIIVVISTREARECTHATSTRAKDCHLAGTRRLRADSRGWRHGWHHWDGRITRGARNIIAATLKGATE